MTAKVRKPGLLGLVVKEFRNWFPRTPLERSKQMQPPFLFVRSRGLWEGEDGKNGRTKPDDLGKLG